MRKPTWPIQKAIEKNKVCLKWCIRSWRSKSIQKSSKLELSFTVTRPFKVCSFSHFFGHRWYLLTSFTLCSLFFVCVLAFCWTEWMRASSWRRGPASVRYPLPTVYFITTLFHRDMITKYSNYHRISTSLHHYITNTIPYIYAVPITNTATKKRTTNIDHHITNTDNE